jgi:hypothetical protein
MNGVVMIDGTHPNFSAGGQGKGLNTHQSVGGPQKKVNNFLVDASAYSTNPATIAPPSL